MNFTEHIPILVIALPLFAAFLTPLMGKISRKAPRYFATAVFVIVAFLVVLLANMVYSRGTEPIIYTLGSQNDTIFRIVLEIDAFSIFMALIMAIVSLAVSIYSWAFVDKYSGQDKFYTLLLLVAVGSYGMVLTGDMFNLFVFFEISSIALCGLVAFRTERGESFEAAFKYMAYSTISGLLLLFAVGIFYSQYGVLNIAKIAEGVGSGPFNELNKIALGLLVTVFALKAGSVPFHMTTPDAYSEAPGGVAALYVAASQAGLYALFRTCFTIYRPVITTETIGWVVIILGVLSMFVGVTMALVQKDIKRLMAYHAISQTGYMLLGVGVGIAVLGNPAALDAYGKMAMEGGIFHIINHAMYKGLLFLTAAAIFYRVGTRNLNEMRGLAHTMKFTTIFFMIGALSIAGIPPMNGFSSKLMIYESVYQFSPILSAIAMLVSVLTLASFVKVFYSAFMGPKNEKVDAKEVPMSMLVGMAILTGVIIVFSLFPGLVVDTIIKPAVEALLHGWPIAGGM